MILKTPDYFEKFECIGGSCKKSCCIGWELEVDEDTFEYYQSVPGEFGDRLRLELDNANKEDTFGFLLQVDGRCPFLNKKNLCDIVLNLGDEALCDICSTYPRHTFTYGDVVEKGLTISCEEACRLLFESPNIINIIEKKLPDIYEYTAEDDDEFEPSESDIMRFKETQKEIFDLVSDLSISFDSVISKLCENHDFPELRSKDTRLQILSLLEPIDSEWLDTLQTLLDKKSPQQSSTDESLYRKLLAYFLYRYLPRGLYDQDLLSKIRFSCFCVFCIMDMEHIFPTLQLVASAFSREVEHSDDNIDIIMEELLFL